MKIDRAIVLITEIDKGCSTDMEEHKSALKLGISALERCKYIAEHTDRWSGVLLPGETKE